MVEVVSEEVVKVLGGLISRWTLWYGGLARSRGRGRGEVVYDVLLYEVFSIGGRGKYLE